MACRRGKKTPKLNTMHRTYHQPYAVKTELLAVPGADALRIGAQSLSEVVNDIVDTAIADTTEKESTVQRYPSVIAYYEFSDPTRLGKDVSGSAYHLTNNGCQHVEDRGGALSVFTTDITGLTVNDTSTYHSLKYLEGKDHVNSIVESVTLSGGSYSVSFWFMNSNVNITQTMLSFVNQTAQTYLRIGTDAATNTITLQYMLNGVDQLVIRHTPSQYTKIWRHICLIVDAENGGNQLFIDGVEMTGAKYVTGDNTVTPLMSTINPTHFTVGALKTNTSDSHHADDTYKQPFLNAFLSDVVIFDSAIDEDIVGSLQSDSYGYDIVIVAGQSNASGRAVARRTLEDFNYLPLQNRVYQFNTYHAIKQGAPTIVIAEGSLPNGFKYIEPAYNPLLMPDEAPVKKGQRPSSDPMGDGIQVGFWRTFCIDYLQTFPKSKRKLLILPCAKGSEGFQVDATTPDAWYAGDTLTKGFLPQILVTALNHLKSTLPLSKVVGLLWNQGESDAVNNSLSFYKQNLLDLRSYVIAQTSGFFSESTPFVLGEVGANGPTSTADYVARLEELYDIYTELVTEYSTVFKIVASRDLTCQEPSHYDAPSINILGQRYFKALVELLNTDTTTFPDPTVPIMKIEGSGQFTKDLTVQGTVYAKTVQMTNHLTYVYPLSWKTQNTVVKEHSVGRLNVSTAGNGLFFGGALAPNGLMYYPPYQSKTIAAFDARTDTITTFGIDNLIVSSTTQYWTTPILAPNGKMYCVPMDGRDILVIDPDRNSFYLLKNIAPSGADKYRSGCLGPDGKIYFTPFGVQHVAVFDPQYETLDTTTITIGGDALPAASYSTAIFDPNSMKMFFIPNSATSLAFIDFNSSPLTFDRTTIPDVLGGNRKYYNACLGTNGYIYAAPWNGADPTATTMLIVNPMDNTVNTVVVPPQVGGGNNIETVGMMPAPDGYIYCIVGNDNAVYKFQEPSTSIAVADLVTADITFYRIGTLDWSSGSDSNYFWQGANLLPDGRIISAPNRASTFVTIRTGVPKHTPWMLDPYFNKW